MLDLSSQLFKLVTIGTVSALYISNRLTGDVYMAKITNEQLNKAFNLSDSFGPTHDGLLVYKMLTNPTGGMLIILKSTKMKMYPVASYGKKEISYIVYSSVFDCYTNDLKTTYKCRFNTLKNCKIFIKSVK